jgi:hypothetical protein
MPHTASVTEGYREGWFLYSEDSRNVKLPVVLHIIGLQSKHALNFSFVSWWIIFGVYIVGSPATLCLDFLLHRRDWEVA